MSIPGLIVFLLLAGTVVATGVLMWRWMGIDPHDPDSLWMFLSEWPLVAFCAVAVMLLIGVVFVALVFPGWDPHPVMS